MIVFTIIIASLIVGAVYAIGKIAYQVGYDNGWIKRDCMATKECEHCVIRGVFLKDEKKRREKINMASTTSNEKDGEMKVTTYFCHRCGNELTAEDKNTIVEQIHALPQFRAVLSRPDGSERGYSVDMVDFCADCHAEYQKAIAKFLEEK